MRAQSPLRQGRGQILRRSFVHGALRRQPHDAPLLLGSKRSAPDMPLMACPGCGYLVSARGVTCPECGHPCPSLPKVLAKRTAHDARARQRPACSTGMPMSKGEVMKVFGLLVYTLLGFVQIAAAAAGLEYLTGLPGFLCWLLALFGWFPIIGTGLGIYGAYVAWGWTLTSAFALLLGVPVALFVMVLVTTAVGVAVASRKAIPRPPAANR
jgi:hypothetical protein